MGTIRQALKNCEPKWFWAHCAKPCGHSVPMAIVPFAIRYGLDADFDLVRRNCRCSKCGHKGILTHHPGWANLATGWQPFPVEREADASEL